ncbi:sporulation protein Cse60 [Bacillus taeanensis]|uniref:Sporulation protein cse60 n=1 Tax=Bacillus taeanensis TaxID=273032 RepID=A0A366Y0N7_9BACI|nr:sporulation protein Cse60 [Bacillus taeanensis]RBW71408.1 sporulation protein cse60 [Bacillus taeanensis]
MIRVKLFDEEHEQDLEESVNGFLSSLNDDQLIDIKYEVAVGEDLEEDDSIFCFSAMVIYKR